MFNAWKLEKATAALVDEAQALADRLAAAKPHVVDSYAATAQVWAATYFTTGQTLHEMVDWPPAILKRFVSTAQTTIAALRKNREYDSSDGLAVWLHTARAITEPRVAPAVRDIWQHLLATGPNAQAMTADLLQDAGLPLDIPHRCPKGFEAGEAQTMDS
jgi:hypothetical protein